MFLMGSRTNITRGAVGLVQMNLPQTASPMKLEAFEIYQAHAVLLKLTVGSPTEAYERQIPCRISVSSVFRSS